jgi:hypothetical protein
MTVYRFDRAAREFSDSFAKGMLQVRRQLTTPVTQVVFFLQPQAITPWEASVFTTPDFAKASADDADITVECTHSSDEVIPLTVDDADEALTRFRRQHGIAEEALGWDRGGLLGDLYRRELLTGLREARKRLESEGIKFEKNAVVALWDEDHEGYDSGEDPARLDADVQAQAAKLGLSADAADALAALCFDDPAKRSALAGMVRGGGGAKPAPPKKRKT